jgi:predicted trehalose synthase
MGGTAMEAADLTRGDLRTLPEDALASWLRDQRWFAAKSRDLGDVHVLETVALPETDPPGPPIVVACVESRFAAGTHDIYQLPLALRPEEEGFRDGVIATVGGMTVYDAFADPEAGAAIARLFRDGARTDGEPATVAFHWSDQVRRPSGGRDVRLISTEQSNTSLVLDSALILKAFRRIEPGDNPELEMLRFLSERGFPNIPALAGWYEYEGDLMDATLGVVQRFIEGGRDGWELALDDLAADPEAFPARVRALGDVVGRMHTVLGSDPADPAFAPEDPSAEGLSLITATIDEQIERTFLDLPRGNEAVAPILGRTEEVRDRLRLLSHVGAGGRLIRHHGDLHLGQTLLADAGWIVLDFEGEPARPLRERRRKRSPLRDVAGMLRSFSYAASAGVLQRDLPVPEGWEHRCREAFLEAYFAAAEPSLLPPGRAATEQLLSVFELEKAVYELRYELDNRPDWVHIPVAGILRLLEEPAP